MMQNFLKLILKLHVCFSAHIYSYHIIKPNICHLGSCRWVNFSEASDKHKVVAIINDFNGSNESVHFYSLKSPIPMIQLSYMKIDKNTQKQPKIAP